MNSSTDSGGMLRSRSALTARSRSFGARARARCTISSPLGMTLGGAAADNVSTALMRSSRRCGAHRPAPPLAGEGAGGG